VSVLLAVDLGLRTGLAIWDRSTGLRSYRSSNFGSVARLKRGAWTTLRDIEGLDVVVVEGSRQYGEIWARAAAKLGARALVVAPETWRRTLLKPKDRRSGKDAKAAADVLARRIIEAYGAPRPSSLRHDAAEAVAIAMWGALEVGWTERPEWLDSP